MGVRPYKITPAGVLRRARPRVPAKRWRWSVHLLNAWKASALFCPGHEPGWDGATLITASKLEPLSSGHDTAKYRVTYDVYGSLDQDSAGFFVTAAPKQVIDTFVTLRTPFGWRIIAPVLDPHLLPHAANSLWRVHERDRRLLDSLRSRE